MWKADTGLTDGNINHGLACRQNMLPHSCRFAHLTFRPETKDVFPIFAFSQEGGSYEVTTSLSQTLQKLSLMRLPNILTFRISVFCAGAQQRILSGWFLHLKIHSKGIFEACKLVECPFLFWSDRSSIYPQSWCWFMLIFQFMLINTYRCLLMWD